MLSSFEPREYQLELYNKAIGQNTLVVLPTGLGKTAIAMMVAARRFLDYSDKKIVFLAPTKPLVEQQLKSFRDKFLIHKDDFSLFTGTVAPSKRKDLWESSKFIFSTPQTMENDVLSGNVDLKDVSLMIFDEAHRGTGDYAYVFLAQKYHEEVTNGRILALTASPGTDKESIKTVCQNLCVEKIEFKSAKDVNVAKYVQKTVIKWKEVILTSEVKKIIDYLNKCSNSKLEKVKEYGFFSGSIKDASRIKLLKLQHALHGNISKGEKSMELLHSISLLSEAMKTQHALELAETQTLYGLHEYMFGILKDSKVSKVKSVKNLARDPNFLSALALLRDQVAAKMIHPKMQAMKNEIESVVDGKKKIIIFTQYRDTAIKIKDELEGVCNSKVFFGQAKKNGIGFSQKEQKAVLESFSAGEFDCLIATSVAEEGLDIPSVDYVFFYEPIPSGIRSVQRRGRTARHSQGNVTIFVSKGTRDEAYRWAAFHKEKKMATALKGMKGETIVKDAVPSGQSKLTGFDKKKKENEELTIYVDHREKGSGLVKSLISMKVGVKLKHLDVGDFVISDKVCVEFKNVRDFVDSIVDGRLLVQLKSLVQYEKPIIMIEGDENIFSIRNVDPSAIEGMLATIATTYRIPVMRTMTSMESARQLVAIMKREGGKTNDNFSFHSAKPMDDLQVLEYVVGSIPGIGGALSKNILREFDSLDRFFKATREELKKIPLLGDKKADDIIRIRNIKYSELLANEKVLNNG